MAYGSTDAPLGGFQKVGGLLKALSVLLMVLVPLQILSIFSQFQLRDTARDFLNGDITEKKFTDAAQANLGSLSIVVVVPIAVLTMILMFRMAANLQRLGRAGATWKPGWGIGGWFCPPCAIYAIPWLMFRELWKGSDPAVPPNDPSWKTGRVPPLINAWWVLYGFVPLLSFATSADLLTNINDFDARRMAQRVDDFLVINLVLGVVGVAATVVYYTFLRQLGARHMSATNEA